MASGIQTGKTTREQFADLDSEDREWKMFSAIEKSQEDIQQMPARLKEKFDECYVQKSFIHNKITYGIVGAIVILYFAAQAIGWIG